MFAQKGHANRDAFPRVPCGDVEVELICLVRDSRCGTHPQRCQDDERRAWSQCTRCVLAAAHPVISLCLPPRRKALLADHWQTRSPPMSLREVSGGIYRARWP